MIMNVCVYIQAVSIAQYVSVFCHVCPVSTSQYVLVHEFFFLKLMSIFIVFLNFYNFDWSLEIAFSYDFRGADVQLN